ncbi:hypothetical protein [Pseudoalteromonas sp. MMG022]|uniref:hypothetical protein n=1 Tax=Pseudoalteromonas sp. MMG022 TaxID=2909978 RepID=UPI001F438ABF|nr:hypothetical protein [Pseudoalteromonas sp. MMG022]MCF6434892.1 hypothetical protein [Pseudoalteromonas sp. MMG022]
MEKFAVLKKIASLPIKVQLKDADVSVKHFRHGCDNCSVDTCQTANPQSVQTTKLPEP